MLHLKLRLTWVCPEDLLPPSSLMPAGSFGVPLCPAGYVRLSGLCRTLTACCIQALSSILSYLSLLVLLFLHLGLQGSQHLALQGVPIHNCLA